VTEIVLTARNWNPLRRTCLGEALVEGCSERGMNIEDVFASVAAFVELFVHGQREPSLDVLERDTVLRALWSGQGRLDLR